MSQEIINIPLIMVLIMHVGVLSGSLSAGARLLDTRRVAV